MQTTRSLMRLSLAATVALAVPLGPGTLALSAQGDGSGQEAMHRRHHRHHRDHEGLVIAEQGSFSVGGHTLQGAGVFDPTKSAALTNEGQTFWVDQMYVQFQIPVDSRKYPLVLVHGGGGTGRVWESTPDGREGYQTIFLRRGYSVYIVDFPRRGRAGLPTFNGNFGNLDSTQIVPDLTAAVGVQWGWTRWRIGPAFPQIFPVQQFPTDQASLDQFFQALVPNVSDNATVITDALVALLDKIGPAILVTHSQSGLFGWLTAIRRPNLVKAIVSYEPGFVFPEGAVPPPIPLFTGAMPAGDSVPVADFAHLTRMPLQVVYGDNIPIEPIPDLVADGRRAQVVASVLFQEAVNSRGGDAEILHLPDVGLRGNSHFMYQDLNNRKVADLLSQFLREKGLAKRGGHGEKDVATH
jgi:pimeloyl-ACP methyl ester carboxylesterase